MISKLGLILILSATTLGHASSDEEKAMVKFYHRHYTKIQSAYVSEVVETTEKWSGRLGIKSQVPVLLSIIHRESEMDPTMSMMPQEDSTGLYQTRRIYREKLRKFWKDRGYTLASNDEDLDNQVAFGVGEYFCKLVRAHGHVWEAVRRYNGGGTKAREYAKKVFKSRKNIFGIVYKTGEHTSTKYGESLAHKKEKKP